MAPRTPLVVLAEDDAELRTLLAQSLRSWGLAVREAANGAELARLLFGPDDLPDLLVTDVRMPGPSGLSTLRCMRVEAWATPVILVTAFPDDALRAEARELGAVVLEKPFPIERLKRVVAQALHS